MRKESASYGEYLGLELGPSSFYQGIFVPERFAHGYLTLEPYSNLTYFMDNFYSPKHSSGLLWNDHNLAIDWPTKPALISNQDLNWPKLII
jgi:dTDP-4-dehydrorhamnose 3,5-epimerase